MKTLIQTLVATLALVLGTASSVAFLGDEAYARAGGGRSIGRSMPSSAYRRATPPRPATPPQSYNPAPYRGQPQVPSAGGGGFFRGMAGGLAGGFLGSMLFHSIGNSFGGNSYGPGGNFGGAGGSGGGIGLFDLLLLAGAAYLAYRWWSNRQRAAVADGRGLAFAQRSVTEVDLAEAPRQLPLRVVTPPLTESEAMDLFFKVQGAWTRRDLASVRGLLGAEIAATLDGDLEELRRARRINRLENISVRKVEVVGPWYDQDQEYVTARFTANLLDYTVDEATNALVDGSATEPVKFEEDWTLQRHPSTSQWQVVAIEQRSDGLS